MRHKGREKEEEKKGDEGKRGRMRGRGGEREIERQEECRKKGYFFKSRRRNRRYAEESEIER